MSSEAAAGGSVLSRGARVGTWAGACVWLVFLADPVRVVLAAEGWRRDLGVVAVLGFVVVYLDGLRLAGQPPTEPAAYRRSMLVRRLHLLGCLVLAAASTPAVGQELVVLAVFLAALSMATLRMREAVGVNLALVAATATAGVVPPYWDVDGAVLSIVLASAAVWGVRTAAVRQAALVAAERALADRALADERARIARDLHDILGHSLTVVTVKAELAERLVDLDPARARAELDDLRRLSRDALADVRSTALGVRGVSLPGEIAAAREALTSAGITAELPGVADEVPSRWRELFAWTVREAVTNVVRHSGASRCVVSVSPSGVVVEDDGVGVQDVQDADADGAAGGCAGLAGLRERARQAGATVTTGPAGPVGGFRVSLRVPA